MPKEKILIVEDNKLNLELMISILSSVNEAYEIITAPNGFKALELAKSEKPDLILLDMQLPLIDGYEVARELKAEPELKDSLIIAVTSYSMRGDREKCLEFGCDGYISKTIDTRKFTLQIKEFLKMKGK
ncbi:MAG: response regulator [Armatimonadetes bacterium]|nr:response regulator [Armatimonadota bacterium]